MIGIAQKKFLESHPLALIKRTTRRKNKHHWALVETMIDHGQLIYSDYFLAETLLKGIEAPSEAVAVFICYLSFATRTGHLCVIVNKSSIHPPIDSLWSKSECEEIDLQEIEQLIIQGASHLPQELVYTPEEESRKPICQDQDYYYLQKYWHYEKQFMEKLHTLIATPSILSPDNESIDTSIKEMVDEKRLLPEQAKAIQQGCTQTLTIITGGPGTGKTYTAGHLIRIFYESLSEKDKERCQITLAAPTGKAAANLQKSLLQSIGNELQSRSLQAKTIHSLLLDKRNRSLSPQGFLHSNFLLIDECSMIDARMMTKLFRSLRPGTKVILLGDKYQLPPVEVGSLFADLTEAISSSVVQLKKCLRADMQGLVDFAQAINHGDSQVVIDSIDKSQCIKRLHINTDLSVTKKQKMLLQEIIPQYKAVTRNVEDILELLKAYQKYRVLCPMRHGPFGVDTLNALINHEISKHSQCIPIMITKNDYNLNLFNGETGLLIKQNKDHPDLQKGDYGAFIVYDREMQTEVVRKVPALLLPTFEYAYVMSVHKSQGSEFQHVFMLLPDGAEVFGREVLYTAATRAKQQLSIWGENHTIEETLKNVSERVSGIKKMGSRNKFGNNI
jgi:exodeoxyribonuclease V alpha subunit